MATTYVTEADAARDLHELLVRARAGENIEIQSELGTFALGKAEPQVWSISEAHRRLDQRDLTATLDDQFVDDLAAIIRQHEDLDPSPRFLSEAIAILDRHGSGTVPDDGFAANVMDGIRSHADETLGDRWD